MWHGQARSHSYCTDFRACAVAVGAGLPAIGPSATTSRFEPFNNDHLGFGHTLAMAARLLIQLGPVTRHRLLVGIELDHHATLRGRPPFHRFAAPAPGQEAAAERLEGSRGALGVLLVLLGVCHVHMGDPIGLHALLSSYGDICV